MKKHEFRALVDLFMVSDPWPLDKAGEVILKAFADEEAKRWGFSNWIEAYMRLSYAPEPPSRKGENKMRKIWKYKIPALTDPFNFGGVFEIEMPVGARIVALQSQRGSAAMWAEVDVDAEREPRKFVVVGTGGQQILERWSYIGTAQIGPFMIHVYEMR